MKKNYIQPEITASVRYSLEKPLCVSIVPEDAATWGKLSGGYANPLWFNEGYDNQEGDVVGIRGNAGTIDSQAKGCGSGWGNIW